MLLNGPVITINHFVRMWFILVNILLSAFQKILCNGKLPISYLFFFLYRCTNCGFKTFIVLKQNEKK